MATDIQDISGAVAGHDTLGRLVGAALFAAAVAPATPASSATLDIFFNGLAGARNGFPPQTFGSLLQETRTLGLGTPLIASEMAEVTDTGDLGGASSSARYSVDGRTGQIRLGVQAEASPSVLGRGQASATVQLVLTETFFVVGSGQLTSGLEFSAEWNALDFGTAGSATIVSSGGVVTNSLPDEVRYNQFVTGGGPGFTKKELTVSKADVFAPEGIFVDVFWQMQGFVGIGGGGSGLPAEFAFIDALNTANIFLRTDGDLSVTAQTPEFLSRPAFSDVTPIPLPAPILMLMTALGGLFFVRTKKSAGKKTAA